MGGEGRRDRGKEGGRCDKDGDSCYGNMLKFRVARFSFSVSFPPLLLLPLPRPFIPLGFSSIHSSLLV